MIETPRLILRDWREEDRVAFIDLCASPEVMEFLGGPSSEEDVDDAIARIRAGSIRNGFCFWAVEDKADGRFIGFCVLKIADAPGAAIEGETEIGWRFLRDAWGQGYAKEAAQATLAWAWKYLDTDYVIAMTVPGNRRSWGLMERIGMVRRPELDFGHPLFAEDHPLHRHIVYVAKRPAETA